MGIKGNPKSSLNHQTTYYLNKSTYIMSTKIVRMPLLRKTTMDETIEEGLNFLRSGGSTYDAECFPITLGKRVSITREALLEQPREKSPKRSRKSPERMTSEPPTKKRRISSSPSGRSKSPSKKAVSPSRKSVRKPTTSKAKSSGPRRAVTRIPTTPVKKTVPKAIKSNIYCPANFNNGSINFDDLNEFRTRTMKDTGADERITEIVFSFDTTGSMGRAIAEARKNIIEITNRLFDTVHGLRIGIIAHGDYCDNTNVVFQVKQLSDNKEDLVKWIKSVVNGSGGDAPENYEQVLEYCNEEMNWTPGSHRVLVVIGDQVAHESKETLEQMKRYNRPNPRAIDWRDQADKCWENGIKIYGVQANTSQDYVKYFYDSLAARTCGTRVQMNDFPMVTDMLLMVCFREANRTAFNDFRDEVTREGRMDKNRKERFDTVSK